MSGWWLSDWWQAGGPVLVVSWVVWVIGSIVLHELAHGWAAIWEGDRTPVYLQRMTWNPLVHMGGTSLFVFALFGIAWGAMPVDPSRFRHRHGDALVAVAGPAMNLLLVIVCIVLGAITLRFEGSLGDPLGPNLRTFFVWGAMLNIVLMLFNLLPVPPLDGSRILSSFVPRFERLWQTENAQWFAFGLFLLVMWFGAEYLFMAGALVAQLGIGGLSGAMGGATRFDLVP